MISQIELWRLQLPLTKPYRVSFKTYHEFEPVVVAIHDDDGEIGWGEAHSPVGSMAETPDSVWRDCQAMASTILGVSKDLAREKVLEQLGPSLNAVSAMASALEMLSRHPTLDCAEPMMLPLLAPVPVVPVTEVARHTDDLISSGYRMLKVKVGWDVQTDLDRVHAVVEAAAGRAMVTIDANRAFDSEAGVAFAAILRPKGVLLLEQPCAADDWNGNAAVAAVCPVPLMLDESISTPESLERAASIDNVQFVKMKLKRLGGVRKAVEMIDHARSLGLGVAFGDGVGSDLDCFLSACAVQNRDCIAYEMNGYLKLVSPLLSPTIGSAEGHLHIPAGFRAQPSLNALRVHCVNYATLAKESGRPPRDSTYE